MLFAQKITTLFFTKSRRCFSPNHDAVFHKITTLFFTKSRRCFSPNHDAVFHQITTLFFTKSRRCFHKITTLFFSFRSTGQRWRCEKTYDNAGHQRDAGRRRGVESSSCEQHAGERNKNLAHSRQQVNWPEIQLSRNVRLVASTLRSSSHAGCWSFSIAAICCAFWIISLFASWGEVFQRRTPVLSVTSRLHPSMQRRTRSGDLMLASDEFRAKSAAKDRACQRSCTPDLSGVNSCSDITAWKLHRGENSRRFT